MIAEAFAETPGLALERSLQTDLYRIDLWRRLAEGETAAPTVETVELGALPAPGYADTIVWGGAEMRRAEARLRETTECLPVLMYHSVAAERPGALARYRTTPAAFAEQMHWLRQARLPQCNVGRHRGAPGRRPFRGRPVLISFDDCYRDFYDTAWPILRAHDFRAEVMVVTGDWVGGTADWDAEYGSPAPLMDWAGIQALARKASVSAATWQAAGHMDDLSAQADSARSRALRARCIERALGASPAFPSPPPFGEASDRFVRITEGCGYKVGFTVDPGFAWLGNDPLRLPRIEVLGGWSIEAFASAVAAQP